MIDYEKRDAVLLAMGFCSYVEYLESNLWKNIRRKVLDNARGLCALCQNESSEVHHLSYDQCVMEGKDLGKLMAICRTCHEVIEFDSSGAKATLGQANRTILILSPLVSPVEEKMSIQDFRHHEAIKRAEQKIRDAQDHQRLQREKEEIMASRRLIRRTKKRKRKDSQCRLSPNASLAESSPKNPASAT